MVYISLRAGTPALCLRRLRSLQSARFTRITAPSRALSSALAKDTGRNSTRKSNAQTTRPSIQFQTLTIQNPQPLLTRAYSSTPRKPTADLLIEEIQDLYEIAKDEFEIATDSTDGATIYAASDRESARDALNQLCAAYHLYTARPGEDVDSGVRLAGNEGEGENGSGEDRTVVETNFNPEDVGKDVRDEVRRRVGQRIRELRNAVEVLEERAHAE
ncbi:uncharacterized protein N7473_011824 [Penicillium subrubescens]|uniref:Uncharacterized protein n=1 Tax=Penicillium subrubescens TaxID=1316194 RepID=A0A1Q5UI31_9EURO|nr:uncharacterized protein N7473_011824 [Penicillium subrubescens]KAJ5880771.1 hypothetical protein N7473_011824 [Penicillium subrubescens]OKP12136.1 hypothetical protein PENSUB_2296 [Penicillium subrubescens]